MPIVTKFVIALCPVAPRYLHADTANPTKTEGVYATSDKAAARLFDTFEDAKQVAINIKGWGGAQRVEQIAVQIPDPPESTQRKALASPAERLAVCALVSQVFHDTYTRCLEENPPFGVHAASRKALAAAVQVLIGDYRRVGSVYRATASCFATITVQDHNGILMTLDWDPMSECFDYDLSGDDGCDLDEIDANTEAEPETATCDGCGATDAEPCGDSEGFAFCAACRKRDEEPVHAPFVPEDAASGTEATFNALLGLRFEQKIVALANALHAAGVTIHRVDEDGYPIIRAVLPNALGTCTVLNL